MAVVGMLVGTFEPARVNGSDCPGGQRERYDKYRSADPPRGHCSLHERQGMSHCSASAASTASANAIGSRIMTLAVSAVLLMARLALLHSPELTTNTHDRRSCKTCPNDSGQAFRSVAAWRSRSVVATASQPVPPSRS